MKSKTSDIEKIGGLKPLTREEEKRISEYLKKTTPKERIAKSRRGREKVE